MSQASSVPLSSSKALVLSKALYALDEFVNNLDSADLKPYLPQLTVTILSLLKPHGSHDLPKEVRAEALQSLGSVISSSGKRILPFMADIMEVLNALVLSHNMSQAEEQALKGKAMLCAGQMASAVGR
mmetsp:Transcript_5131/g.3815  ORF Transcript_5131/g.3815 Transcript_5131/m.3815 type:complete len:128 (-) Transcript_5131:703-1086(-)